MFYQVTLVNRFSFGGDDNDNKSMSGDDNDNKSMSID